MKINKYIFQYKKKDDFEFEPLAYSTFIDYEEEKEKRKISQNYLCEHLHESFKQKKPVDEKTKIVVIKSRNVKHNKRYNFQEILRSNFNNNSQ